jgi:hypothetical protein
MRGEPTSWRVDNPREELGIGRAKSVRAWGHVVMTPADDRYQARPWGERLRVWREEVKRWSRAEFRDEVEAASYKIGESRGHKLDERLIARWETGAVARPQAVYCRILAHMDAPLPSSAEPIGPPSTEVIQKPLMRRVVQMSICGR